MIARIIYCHISFRQLPDRVLDSFILIGRCKYLADRSLLISIVIRQAKLDSQWLQCAVILEKKDSSGGVSLCCGGVDPSQVRHQSIVVIQYEQLIILDRLFLFKKEIH